MELTKVSLGDLTRASARVRKLGEGAHSMEEAAREVVRFIFESFVDAKGERSCALVRLYETQPYSALPAELQAAAGPVPGAVRCLTLLASAGVEESWNSRKTSRGHRAIPLTSAEAVEQLPMVSQLLVQLGVDVSRIDTADRRLIIDEAEKSFNVFHVAQAKGSPFIPAQQQFVEPYRVQSVLGFGSGLPSGELFALILFAREPISRATAELFRPLALAIKLALLPFDRKVFAA